MTTHPPMTDFSADSKRRLDLYILVLLCIWSLIIGGFLLQSKKERQEFTLQLARKEAIAAFNKDQASRFWSTVHGGVYVPASERTPPSPHLAHVPERDIITPSGRNLTLMNPAYMLRQMMEEYEELYGIKGHITSLKFFNPLNAPDDWEKAALLAFEQGVKEVFDVFDVDGERYMRLIRPMITNQGCLKCHAKQGYQAGDVRGGVGVSVPMEPYFSEERAAIGNMITTDLIIWLVGLLGITMLRWRGRVNISDRQQYEEKLQEANLTLEQRVEERTLALRNEINDHLQTQEQLEQSKGKIEQAHREWLDAFDTIKDLVFLHDRNGDILRVNQAFADFAGLPAAELSGRPYWEFFSCGDKPFSCCVEEFDNGNGRRIKENIVEQNGQFFYSRGYKVTSEEGDYRYSIHIIEEITEQKKMEEMLLQSEKISTVSGLAAGVAHEINTPLSAILQASQIIEQSLRPGQGDNDTVAGQCGIDLDKLQDYFHRKELDFFFDGIKNSAEDASKIINMLIQFSQPPSGELRKIKLTDLLDNAVELTRLPYLQEVEVVREYDPDQPEITCRAKEIEQALVNLIKNAGQALTAVGNMAPTKNRPRRVVLRARQTNNMAHIEVEDNGAGMDEVTRRRVFDPFFTTREIGAGTGLGLTVAYTIICDRHKGTIQVESEPGQGTKFVIELPVNTPDL